MIAVHVFAREGMIRSGVGCRCPRLGSYYCVCSFAVAVVAAAAGRVVLDRLCSAADSWLVGLSSRKDRQRRCSVQVDQVSSHYEDYADGILIENVAGKR